jgi:hypothetical protein
MIIGDSEKRGNDTIRTLLPGIGSVHPEPTWIAMGEAVCKALEGEALDYHAKGDYANMNRIYRKLERFTRAIKSLDDDAPAL